jgi:cytochrome c5
MSKESDKKFFTLFTLIVIAISILMIVFYFLGGKYGDNQKTPLNINKAPPVEAPTAEVAMATATDEVTMSTEGEPASVEEAPAEEMAAASGDADGKAIYDKVCVACHAGAIPGIPKLGDKVDWEPRIAQGNDVLYEHAINGFMGATMPMPPKGGAELSDDEVKAAVDYMVQSSQ